MIYKIGFYCFILLVIITSCNNTVVEINDSKVVLTEMESSQLTYILSSPETVGDMSVEEALENRRSRRNFQDKALSVEQLSQILWAAYGITEPSSGKRTAPSAGASYPLEIYLAVGDVTNIEAGIYKYDSREHKIVRTIDGEIREELGSTASATAQSKDMVRKAPMTVVYTAVFSKLPERYGGREKYVFIEIGHSAQNVYLQAEALGLGTCAIGSFTENRVSELLGLPKDEEPMYLMPVGYGSE